MRIFIITLVTLLSSFSAISCSYGMSKHALLIGVQDYSGSDIPSLEGPKNDLHLMRQILTDRFQFKNENVTMLIDEQASHSKIAAAFSALESQIKEEDFVYIHYSGHGSFTPDLNGDERRGQDQTWVSYGARPKGHRDSNIDNYDVLDDELNFWLAKILAKTDHMVFVSDSCHSGSVTRGTTTSRALPEDTTLHPLGTKFPATKLNGGIRIGAARDQESAREFINPDDNQAYGLFTWHWAKSLQSANSQETWANIFKRTDNLVSRVRGSSQHPQMSGPANRTIFGGEFVEPSRTIPILKVSGDKKTVRIAAGSLSGVTKKSTYRLANREDKDTQNAKLEIVRVKANYSDGKVLEGVFKKKDQVVEESHVYDLKPFKVYLNGDYKEGADGEIIQKLTDMIEAKDFFELDPNQKSSDIVLYVVRPRKNSGAYVYDKSGDTLPKSFEDQQPEVWVLSSTEQLISDKLKVKFANLEHGLKILGENLEKYARVHEVTYLASTSGATLPIKIETLVLRPEEFCEGDDCIDVGDNEFRKIGIFSMEELAKKGVNKGDILTFQLKNDSKMYDYFCYLLTISADGTITANFPTLDMAKDVGRIETGESLDLFKHGIGVGIDTPGKETVKLIASRTPIDHTLLQQEGYRTRGTKGRSSMNPLEKLLSSAMHGTRGANASLGNNKWGTVQFSFKVSE